MPSIPIPRNGKVVTIELKPYPELIITGNDKIRYKSINDNGAAYDLSRSQNDPLHVFARRITRPNSPSFPDSGRVDLKKLKVRINHLSPSVSRTLLQYEIIDKEYPEDSDVIEKVDGLYRSAVRKFFNELHSRNFAWIGNIVDDLKIAKILLDDCQKNDLLSKEEIENVISGLHSLGYQIPDKDEGLSDDLPFTEGMVNPDFSAFLDNFDMQSMDFSNPDFIKNFFEDDPLSPNEGLTDDPANHVSGGMHSLSLSPNGASQPTSERLSPDLQRPESADSPKSPGLLVSASPVAGAASGPAPEIIDLTADTPAAQPPENKRSAATPLSAQPSLKKQRPLLETSTQATGSNVAEIQS